MMKKHGSFLSLMLLLALNGNSHANERSTAAVQTVHNDLSTTTFNNSLSPDGQLIYFTQVASDFSGIHLYQGHQVDGITERISPVVINGIKLGGTDVHISPDGTKLLYSARSAFNSDAELGDYNLYVSEKLSTGWSVPTALPAAINSSADEFYPTMTHRGDIYFARRIKDQNLDIFVSYFEDGKYQPAQRLNKHINTEILEGDAFIAPDESYLIFARMKAPDSYGMTDLYISYKTAQGWTAAKNLGVAINSQGIDGSPFVSRDGQWLYFTSNRDSVEPEKFDANLGLYRTAFDYKDWQ